MTSIIAALAFGGEWHIHDKDSIKTSFPKYRNNLRIKHAVQMFKDKKHLHMSIEGISTQSGFKIKSAFYAAFKDEYKMTPTEWIEKNI
mgnify:CR=1 FL=1